MIVLSYYDIVSYDKKYLFGLPSISLYTALKTLAISWAIRIMGVSFIVFDVFCLQIAIVPEIVPMIKVKVSFYSLK